MLYRIDSFHITVSTTPNIKQQVNALKKHDNFEISKKNVRNPMLTQKDDKSVRVT